MENPPHYLVPSAFTVDRCPPSSPLVYAIGTLPNWLQLVGAGRNERGISQRQFVSGLSGTPLADLPRGNAQEEQQNGAAQKRVIRDGCAVGGYKVGPYAESCQRAKDHRQHRAHDSEPIAVHRNMSLHHRPPGTRLFWTELTLIETYARP